MPIPAYFERYSGAPIYCLIPFPDQAAWWEA